MIKTILIADDSKTCRHALSELFTSAGYFVKTCKNGADAKVIVEQIPVHLVFTDYEMPLATGRELTLFVKSRDDLRHIPVIMMSGIGEVNKFADLMEKGFVSVFIPKPFGSRNILGLVKMLIK